MSTSATILADSISPTGARLTTFQVRAPRFILAQLSKHRAFSISCRSSRAVPVRKMIDEVLADPVVPRFGKNRRGMKAESDIDANVVSAAALSWHDARLEAADYAEELANLGVAKEVCNRLLEPFGWFDAVISATDYLNFFSLRIHPDAQHEIRDLAVLMARAYRASTPRMVDPADWGKPAGWHLPYVSDDERSVLDYELSVLREVSAARCGRVSYVPHDSHEPDVAKDLIRAGMMLREMHAVPFEHVASPSLDPRARSGNFAGWNQYRHLVFRGKPTFDWDVLDQMEAAR